MKIGHEIFELERDIIGTNLLTKFHEDRTRNVTSRVFTTKCGRTDGRRTKTDPKILYCKKSKKMSSYYISLLSFTYHNQYQIRPSYILGRMLSSDNHLMDGPTDRQTDRPT
ncbi:hypothetical protein DPMN_151135 [Dreissena polymorpha]|uniref:Uncharacterized protein n=1 Tax=Dreissena polymorpha TaxID=45954 RepID=A0A9D4FKL3_DREPO|nr:hypothetical protein DPMN_151135 [Dreissena polymorpha]